MNKQIYSGPNAIEKLINERTPDDCQDLEQQKQKLLNETLRNEKQNENEIMKQREQQLLHEIQTLRDEKQTMKQREQQLLNVIQTSLNENKTLRNENQTLHGRLFKDIFSSD